MKIMLSTGNEGGGKGEGVRRAAHIEEKEVGLTSYDRATVDTMRLVIKWVVIRLNVTIGLVYYTLWRDKVETVRNNAIVKQRRY
jgi:hypothetical protein